MMNLDASYNNKRLWFVPHTATHDQPVRYTKDDIVIVKSEAIGSPSDPYSDELLIGIRGTDYFVALSLEHEGVDEWFYDLKNARLATPQGRKLRGKQGVLPTPIRDLLYKVWGDRSLEKNAPQRTLG